jgi:rubredoxin
MTPMARYMCVCGWIYDEAKGLPSRGIAPGTKWEDLPDDFCCPDCGTPKSGFYKMAD